MACTVTELPPAVSLSSKDGITFQEEEEITQLIPEDLTNAMCSSRTNIKREDTVDDDTYVASWNPCLYSLQLKAPRAIPLLSSCTELPVVEEADQAQHLKVDTGYHGLISKADAVELLHQKPDGTYLIRRSMSGKTFLSFRFNNDTYHHTIQFNNGNPVYGDKEFDCITELLNDTLILLYIEKHENVNQKLEQGQTSHSNSKVFKRRQGRYKRRGHYKRPDSQLSNDSFSPTELDSTDGLSPTPSLSSLTDTHTTNEEDDRETISDLDQSKGQQRILQQAWKKGSTKSVTETSSGCSFSFLPIPRCSTSPSQSKNGKTVSTGDLSNLQSMLATLVQTTVATEHITLPVSRTSSNSSFLEKSHNFHVATYRRATWCDICHHFMWGLVQQGLSCQGTSGCNAGYSEPGLRVDPLMFQYCGINVHKQCVEASNKTECIPSRKMIKKTFGVDLTTLVMIEGGRIPLLVQMSVAYIENNYLENEGLYRLSGSTSKVMDIKEKFDDGDVIQWDDVDDGNTITGAVKLYFRELPNPLITYDVYPLIIEAITDPNTDDTTLKQILSDKLPISHYETLKFFINHLKNVAQFSHVNKMMSSNLAVVFAPTLMKPLDGEGMDFTNIPHQQNFIRRLIDNYDTIFA